MHFSSQLWMESRGYQILVMMAVALLFVIIIYSHCQEKSLARQEKKLALDRCLDEGKESNCRKQIKANHDKCFRYNYKPGSKTAPAFFNREQYYECLMMGKDEWIKRERKKKAQQFQDERKTQQMVNEILDGD